MAIVSQGRCKPESGSVCCFTSALVITGCHRAAELVDARIEEWKAIIHALEVPQVSEFLCKEKGNGP